MMNVDQIHALLRREVLKAGGPRRWAEEHGLAYSYVYDVMAERRNPGKKLLAGWENERRNRCTKTWTRSTHELGGTRLEGEGG